MNEKKRQYISFNEFELDTNRQQLFRNGKSIALYAKTFELLRFLVENSGRILTKDEILETVWEGQFVEEANLPVQISALRKVLGEKKNAPRFLVTVPGKGYKFIADVKNSNTEIVIEKHKISRVVIEEEIDNENTAVVQNIEAVLPATRNSTKSINSYQSSIRSRNTQQFALLSAISVSLLLLVSGFWLYRERAERTVIASPSGQMNITRMTDGINLGAPTISPDGKFIAYIENSSTGSGSLFLQQTETNTVLSLLEPDERTFGCINFSPDGSLIYYIVYDKRDPYAALYSVSVLGGMPKRILRNLGSCFSVSPDGKRVAFYRDDPKRNQTSLMITSVDGSEEKKLITRDNNELNFNMGLAWSPDGNLIAFGANNASTELNSGTTIFGVGVNNGNIKPLTDEKFTSLGKMNWTSDGNSLIFIGYHHDKHSKLYSMDYPSGNVRQVTNDLHSYGNYGLGITANSRAMVADIWERTSEIWSIDSDGDASTAVRITNGKTDGRFGIAPLPNGRIAYISRSSNSLEIQTAKENNTEAKVLTSDTFTQKDIVASPDGRYLIFSSDQMGKKHIFRMNVDDGSEVTQLTFGESKDSQPDVSPDGQTIIYTSKVGKRSTIWTVPLMGGRAVQLTDYESGSPVFSPDGKMIACVLLSDSRAKLASIAIIRAEGGQPLKSFKVMPFQHYYRIIRWTPDGEFIVFDKNEKSVFNLWKQSISGGLPQQLTNFSSSTIWKFNYSHDGKHLFISRGSTFVNVVLLKNFR